MSEWVAGIGEDGVALRVGGQLIGGGDRRADRRAAATPESPGGPGESSNDAGTGQTGRTVNENRLRPKTTPPSPLSSYDVLPGFTYFTLPSGLCRLD